MSTNGVSHPEQYSAPGSNPTTDASQSSSGGKFSKDEVGWYFVEQYYTTLSKSPDKLHLFHGKKSQFVYGQEAEVSPVSVGRQDIQERIQKLDFQDCKVRISNVDAQASFDNIVIQVIGETSNKSEEPRKFVQTFVLAQQPSGYFVLNDIMRFIKEEEEETAEVAAPAEAAAEPVAPEAKPEPEPEPQPQPAEVPEVVAPKAELDTAVVDKKLEEATTTAPELESAPTVAVPVEVAASPVPAAPVEVASTPAEVPDAQKIVEEVAEEEVKKAETPKDPSPTPAAARAAPVAAAPPVEAEKPKEPPKPMTWASRAAAAAGTARSPVALPKPATPPANSTKPPAAAAPSAAKTTTENTAAATAAPTAPAAGKESNEWQTAGSDSKRQNRPQSISASAQDKDKALGYVKYVTEKVDEATLRQHLEQYGPVVYFDINRSKNCAFIEFASQAGYLAAVADNPHTINGETIMVEARRPKASAYGGANYSNNRGGMSGRGRGGYEGRAGSQGGGRGGFSGQNRGRGGAAGAARGGRGASQVANA